MCSIYYKLPLRNISYKEAFMKLWIYFFLLLTIPLFSGPTTVIVSLDGFRYDYMNQVDTPVLDSLTHAGVRAISFQPVFPTKTFPSHISMATGLYPESHGIIDNNFENLITGEYYTINDNSSKMVAKWYRGEFIWETLARYGYGTAAYLWPGSENYTPWKRPTFSIAWADSLNYSDRLKKFDFWLNQMHEDRVPELFMLYFDDTDIIGHKYGTDSDEIKTTIAKMDSVVGEICKIIDASDNKENTNLIIFSDHGMINISQEHGIDISTFKADGVLIQNSRTFCRLSFKDKSQIGDYYRRLKNINNIKVYKKSDIPQYLHFSNDPNIGDIVLIAEPGYYLNHEDNDIADNYKALHGYDSQYIDMQGIFIASGFQFKVNTKTSTIMAVDLYALLCRLYEVEDYKNTESDLDRISFILK